MEWRLQALHQLAGVNIEALLAAGSLFHPLAPVRILDSRPATQVGSFNTPWGGDTSRDIAVGGISGVPANADTAASSFLSIWPAGQTKPTVSSLNWAPGVTIPNAVTVKLGTAAKISLYNLAGTVNVVTDVTG